MAGSRLERLGTIFGRVTALIKTGAIKKSEKPLWYDVYRVFPPITTPSFATIREKPEIKTIFYPEDKIRARFHHKMIRRLPAEDLMKETTTDLTRRAIDLTNKLMLENEKLTLEEAVDQAIEIFKKEGLLFVRRSVRSQRIADQFREQIFQKPAEVGDTANADQYKIISDKKIDIASLLNSKDDKKDES